MIDSFLLREEADGSQKRIEHYYPQLEVKRGRKNWHLAEKKTTQCPTCHHEFGNCTKLPFPDRYIPLVMVGLCQAHGQFFKAVDQFDLDIIRKVRSITKRISMPPGDSLRVIGGPKSSGLLSKQIQYYSDLFTPRQLLYISTAKEFLRGIGSKHRIWLALLISTSLEFNSVLCGYKGTDKRRPGAIRHVFSHHAYSFPYTSLESNPIFSHKTSGTLRRLFEDRIKDAGEWAAAPIERELTSAGWRKVTIQTETDSGLECSSINEFKEQTRRFIVEQRDSSQIPLPDASVDFVVTDPPYFDSVQYSDLSHFFRVWLQWFVPNEGDWSFEHLTSAVAETGANAQKYCIVLTAILKECNRVLRRPHGRLIFTFHHWRADAWVQLILALKGSAFKLINFYTVHSENPTSVHIRHLRALKHDSILVLQPGELYTTARKFKFVDGINGDDSFRFCSDCAELLGFCLDNELKNSEITQLWQSALKE